MNNNDNKNDDQSQTDLSKSQGAQQPQGSQADQTASDQLDDDTTGQSSDSTSGQAGMADYGSAERADALTQNRSDTEGSSLNAEPTDQNSGGFVGSDSQSDTSSELIDDEDSQAPEGK